MILFTYGTRPEYLKTKPLIEEFKRVGLPYKVLCTGQHKNIIPEEEGVVKLLDDRGDLSNNRLDNIIAKIFWELDDVFNAFELINEYEKNPHISHILVQGDTTSVLALAISAFHHKKKIIHLEAGLRTNDFKNPFPEEANRQLVSRITDIHLAPTETAKNNLLKENISKDQIYVVGNTVLDNLVEYLDRCVYGDKVLVTLHRRENHEIMHKWFEEIDKIAEKYPKLDFILPLHPNPNVQKHRNMCKHVKIIDPLSHSELLEILIKSKLVITDSGGIQEECSFFKKKCLVCRKDTERPESIGLTSHLVKSPEDLNDMFIKYNEDCIPIEHSCPYGDGNSSKIITNILKKLVYEVN